MIQELKDCVNWLRVEAEIKRRLAKSPPIIEEDFPNFCLKEAQKLENWAAQIEKLCLIQ